METLGRPESRVALITGASSGLGSVFARELAAAGYDVVLSARRTELLEALAVEIERTTPQRAYVVAGDLGARDGAERLHAVVVDRGLEISYLVNNAGVTVEGNYLEFDWESQRACTQLMALAPAELIHRFLPVMVERGHGRVLNVSSLGAYWPCFPGMTVYGPSKTYLLRLTRTLAVEYRTSGVAFSVVCPFLTRTAFLDGPTTRKIIAHVPEWLIAEPADVVRIALDGIERGHVVQHTTWLNRALALGLTLLPPRLTGRAIETFVALADRPTQTPTSKVPV